MQFFKQRNNLIFLFIIFLLVASLSGVSYFAYAKSASYKVLVAQTTNVTSAMDEAQKKIDELTAKIAEYDSKADQNESEKAELNSKLEAAIAEKDRLQKENDSLKSQLETLKAQRRDELQKQIALKNTQQADTAGSGICYLTFDDGPSNNTLKILDILDAYGIKGTFFVVGTGNQGYMPQITSRGHAIGLHSANHRYDIIYRDVNSYLEDIKQISDIVYNATGVRSNIMRFPGGSSNSVSASYCPGIMSDLTVRMPSLGYSYFDWNVSSGDADAAVVPAQTIVNRVLSGARGKNSICVLMHDNSAKTTTVQALPDIIEGLDAMGFRFAPLTADVFGFHQPVSN